MSDIVEFLNARLDEDEAQARHAIDGDLDHLPAVECRCGRRFHLGGDAVRVLREVEAKRGIIDDYLDALRCAPTDMSAEAGRVALLCALRALAGVYSDHPDYREEWRALIA